MDVKGKTMTMTDSFAPAPVFFAVVHQEGGSAFGVHFPDLPGCFSAADTIDDVIPNAVEALELWFDDAPAELPEPGTIDAVRTAAAGDLAAGAFIVAVPLLRNSGRMKRVNLSLDAGMLAAIDAEAAMRKLTRSAFLAQSARNEIAARRNRV
jgi:predicted RNase H-like HicB family nuclease